MNVRNSFGLFLHLLISLSKYLVYFSKIILKAEHVANSIFSSAYFKELLVGINLSSFVGNPVLWNVKQFLIFVIVPEYRLLWIATFIETEKKS